MLAIVAAIAVVCKEKLDYKQQSLVPHHSYMQRPIPTEAIVRAVEASRAFHLVHPHLYQTTFNLSSYMA